MFGLKLMKSGTFDALKEVITATQRTIEDMGWINLNESDENNKNLIRGGFKKMLQRVKMFYYNDPLAGHWVHLTTWFTFGEGVSTPRAQDEAIQEVIDEFWDDSDNKNTLTSFQAQQFLSDKLQYEGNLFFLLFDDEAGNVRVRILNTQEVNDIIKDPDDKMRTNFYKVHSRERKFNFLTDAYEAVTTDTFVYYPDKDNWNPEQFNVPKNKLRSEVKIYHVRINTDINDAFGVPELYRGIDWMNANKNMMGDLATLVKALSKFAWKKKVKGSATQVASIAGNLSSKTDLSTIRNSAGQTQVENTGVDLQSIDVKTGGVKIGIETGRQMKLMVSAAASLPEHYWGDPSTSNLATSKSLELPVLKKFEAKQKLWEDIFNTILQYQIDVKISVGVLPGTTIEDPKHNRVSYETPLDRHIDIDFPPIDESDIDKSAKAYSLAKDKGLIGEDLASQLFMLDANVNNVEEEIEIVKKENLARKEDADKKFEMTAKIDSVMNPAKPKKKGKPDPLKEAIDVPGKEGNRLDRKSNFLTQKLNGYRKALAGNFRQLQREIKEATEVAENNGVATGIVRHVENIIRQFGDRMKASSRVYFPIAIEIGEKFMQAELKDLNIEVTETLNEAKGKAEGVLTDRLAWNDEFIAASFVPDIIEKVNGVQIQAQESAIAYRRAINDAVLTFEPRVEHYVGALWTVEEMAVKEAGSGTGVQVNFAGVDDDVNCEGCQRGIDGNPWAIEDAPIPGLQECLGNCRHALQVIQP